MAYADRTTDSIDTPSRSAAPGDPTPRSAATRNGAVPPRTVQPAHPLPAQRSTKLDYDRYLERSTSKFKIFSAEERRKRKRTAIGVGIVLIVVVIIVVWAICSQG